MSEFKVGCAIEITEATGNEPFFKVGDQGELTRVDEGGYWYAKFKHLQYCIGDNVTEGEPRFKLAKNLPSDENLEDLAKFITTPKNRGKSVAGLGLWAGSIQVPNFKGSEGEHPGGSSSYYMCHVKTPTTLDKPYDAECNDVIESLNMTFAEANAFKAIWRTAAARQGKKKLGNNAVYDAEKVVFFGNRMLVLAKAQEEL